MKKLTYLFLTILTVLAMTSCEKEMKNSELTVKLSSEVASDVKFEQINLHFINKETGKETTKELSSISGPITLNLSQGVYDIKAMAKGVFNEVETDFSGRVENFSLRGKQATVEVVLLPSMKGDFVIKEIFYSGGTKENGRPYTFGHYVILTNNTDHLLYADSIVFAGTAANTKIPNDNYRPHLPKIGVQFMFMIPGNGKSHPVKPGEDVVICMEAKNHKEIAPNVPNLAEKADFEWFEPNDRFQLTDNPNVPNMEILFKTSMSITALHMRGLTSYFIFHLPMPMDRLMKEHAIETAYPNPKVPPVLRPFIPDTWVMDAIELSDGPEIDAKALPVSVDKTHSYCEKSGKGQVLRRRVLYLIGKQTFWKDTNDSKEDFECLKESSILN